MITRQADINIYVGGESDEWVEDALKEATNKDMVVINLSSAPADQSALPPIGLTLQVHSVTLRRATRVRGAAS